jgi:hypothetical protein
MKESVLEKIIMSYDRYFSANPYTRWFGKPSPTGAYNLEGFLNGFGASFYTEDKVGCVHLDLIPFATLDDFSGLDQERLRLAMYEDRWAPQNLNRLLELLKPERIFILGRTNVEWFNRFYSKLSLTCKYSSGQANASYGHSTVQINHKQIAITGISCNLGNPIGFDKKSLTEFGSFFKKSANEKYT